MRVSDLTRQKPVEVVIDLGDGDAVTVQFDRNMVTPAWVEAGREDAFLSRALSEVILSWDVVNDDGSAYEPTSEHLAVLSFDAQARLLERIVEAAVPSRAEGNASSAPTSTPPMDSAPPQQTPQNGMVTSPSLELSASRSPS